MAMAPSWKLGERNCLAGSTPAPSAMNEEIKVGSLVQWESNGVYQFDSPKIIRRIIDDPQHGQYALVFGSNTGVPMSELILWKNLPKNK